MGTNPAIGIHSLSRKLDGPDAVTTIERRVRSAEKASGR
jgi:hypothetical protein